jgi:hypothetical protein
LTIECVVIVDQSIDSVDLSDFRAAFASMIKVRNATRVSVKAVPGSAVVTATIEAEDPREYDAIVGILRELTLPEASKFLSLLVSQVQLAGLTTPSPPPRAPQVQPPGSRPAPPASPSLWGDLDEWMVESLITAAVLLGSSVIAAGLSLWIKKFVNTSFQMMQTVDIGLAAMDFGTDVLFIVTAFTLQKPVENPTNSEEEVPKGNAATSLAWASLIFLFIAGSISFFGCLMVVLYYWRRRTRTRDDIINWRMVKEHSNLYGILAVLSIADIEIIKLYPWRAHTYDGFPEMGVAIVVTCIALLEDVPQLIIQIIFVSTVEPGVTAALFIGLTVSSICWRVAKRSLRLMGTAALEWYPDVDEPATTPSGTPAPINAAVGAEAEVKITAPPAMERLMI